MALSPLKTLAAPCLVAGILAASAASADVFSSQGFTGGPATLDALPGVNFDVVPGSPAQGNCQQVDAPAFSFGDRSGVPTQVTECKVGNFTFTTSGGEAGGQKFDPTYNGNPPPWAGGWRQ